VLGIHRFMGQAMAVTNTIGNSVATVAIGRYCGQADDQKLRSELNQP
jgi:aerobic C4-dicarboxylate transport protein